MKKICLITAGIMSMLFLSAPAAFCQQSHVDFLDSEVVVNCYDDGTCLEPGEIQTRAALLPSAAADSPPVFSLNRLRYRARRGHNPVGGAALGLNLTVTTTPSEGTPSEEIIPFLSMPTTVEGIAAMLLPISGTGGTNESGGTSFSLTYSTNAAYVYEENCGDVPYGCCQITLECGKTFCYSAPNFNNIPETVCEKLDYILTSRGLGSAAWSDDYLCDYTLGECYNPTIISLASFDADAGDGEVVLTWVTEAEIDTLGYTIYRSQSKDGPYEPVSEAVIPAEGTPSGGMSYTFVDEGVKNRKTYYYYLEDVDIHGVPTRHGPVSATPRLLYRLVK